MNDFRNSLKKEWCLAVDSSTAIIWTNCWYEKVFVDAWCIMMVV